MIDAESYAKSFGVSIEEALVRLQRQDSIEQLETRLASAYARTFAGMRIEHVPTYRVILLVTQDDPTILRDYVPKDLSSLVQIETVDHSLADLEQDHKEVIQTLQSLRIKADTWIDIHSNRVEVMVADQISLDRLAHTDVARFPETTTVTWGELSSPAASIYAGLALSSCTSGFSVVNSSGTRGISTAAHCSNSLSYSGVALPFQTETTIAHDVQWHTPGTHSPTNRFQDSTSGTSRQVTATRHRDNQTIGEYICKYGKTTGYTCGTIDSKNFCPNYITICNPTFIRVTVAPGYANFVQAGDSGGPVFWNTTAYGIVSGAQGTSGIYMASNFYGALNLTILTTP